MTTNDHIAAIKEHLRAIEAEKQPKNEPKRYLVIPVEETSACDVMKRVFDSTDNKLCSEHYRIMKGFFSFKEFICSGKIITLNEE